MEILNMLLTGTNQGILWGVLALGVFVTFRLLDFADLTVEGSFATGGAVAAMLILKGCDPLLASLVALVAGAAAGAVTGLLNTKLKIPPILAGILTMTALYTINLLIMGSRSSIAVESGANMFAIVDGWFKGAVGRNYIILIIGLIISAFVVGGSYWFFGTEIGSSIRATGANEKMCRAQGVNTDWTKILGLMISNALVAFSGALVAQQQGNATVNMGVGAIVIGLASVVIGETIVSAKHNFCWRLISIFIGSIIYRLIIAFVYYLGLGTEYIKLLTAVIIIIALSLPQIKNVFNHKKRVKTAVANPTDVVLNDELASKIEKQNEVEVLSDAQLEDNKVVEEMKVEDNINSVEETVVDEVVAPKKEIKTDTLIPEVLGFIVNEESFSAAKLQKRFAIGYNRASSIVEWLKNKDYIESAQRGYKAKISEKEAEDIIKQLEEVAPSEKESNKEEK